ncbi:MAG: hypothetical protein R2731_12545 [Nocardioides sp.]
MPEVRALVLAAEATAAVETGDLGAAVAGLLAAAEVADPTVPVTAAVLRGTVGMLLADDGQGGAARARRSPPRSPASPVPTCPRSARSCTCGSARSRRNRRRGAPMPAPCCTRRSTTTTTG